jgi:hypothetical protein
MCEQKIKFEKRKILGGKKRALNSHAISLNHHKFTTKKTPVCAAFFPGPLKNTGKNSLFLPCKPGKYFLQN